MQDFRKLRVWHLARRLTLAVIDALPAKTARKVPGLRSQAIRAATSVESNIAEGCSRTERSEFLQFVEIAIASANELDEQLSLARDAKVVSEAEHARQQLTVELVRRMLISLKLTLERRIAEDESARRRGKRSA
jgi:four helix bundle protein